MPRHWIARAAVAAVMVAAAIALFFVWIPMHQPTASRLADLAVTGPVSGLQSGSRATIARPSSSPLAPVRSAAKATVAETGVYSVDWRGVKPVTSASLDVIVLPSDAYARATQSAAATTYLQQTSFTDAGYGFGGRFHVPGVPGARSADFALGVTPVITPSTPRTDVVVYRTGRIVVMLTLQGGSPSTNDVARSLALAEYKHLGQSGTAPVLGETVVPVVATIVFWVVALALIVGVQVGWEYLDLLGRRRTKS